MLAYVGYGLVQLRGAGVDLGSLVTTSAILTAVIAFSMQDTLGNVLGGLAIQLDNSVQVGDWIRVDSDSPAGCATSAGAPRSSRRATGKRWSSPTAR